MSNILKDLRSLWSLSLSLQAKMMKKIPQWIRVDYQEA